jgi:hypothetical protein
MIKPYKGTPKQDNKAVKKIKKSKPAKKGK